MSKIKDYFKTSSQIIENLHEHSNKIETMLTDQLKKVIVSVNGVDDIQTLHKPPEGVWV